MSAGDAGLEESRDAREGVTELEDEMEDGMDEGGTGTGERETLMMGLQGSEETIS